jgi:hypothetical protein
MFSSWKGFLGFLAGLLMTIGLLLSPNLIPGRLWYVAGLEWSLWQVLLAAIAGLGVLTVTLWVAGRTLRGAQKWNQPRVVFAALLIGFVANDLYVLLVDLFALRSGLRALVAVAGVPVIYGNLVATLGKMRLRQAMVNILTGGLATMGGAMIIASIIRGWQ